MASDEYIKCETCQKCYHKIFAYLHKDDCQKGSNADPSHPYIYGTSLVFNLVAPSTTGKNVRKITSDTKSDTHSSSYNKNNSFTTKKLGLLEERCLRINPLDLKMSGIGQLGNVVAEIGGKKEPFFVKTDCKTSVGTIEIHSKASVLFPFNLKGKKIRVSKIAKVEKAQKVYLQNMNDKSINPCTLMKLVTQYFKYNMFDCFPYLYSEGQIVSFEHFNEVFSYKIKQISSCDNVDTSSASIYQTPNATLTQKVLNESINVTPLSLTSPGQNLFHTPMVESPMSSSPKADTMTNTSSNATPRRLRRKRHKKKNLSTTYYKWCSNSQVELVEENEDSDTKQSTEYQKFFFNDQYRDLKDMYEQGRRLIGISGMTGSGKTRLVEEFAQNESLCVHEVRMRSFLEEKVHIDDVLQQLSTEDPCILLIENFDQYSKVFQEQVYDAVNRNKEVMPDHILVLLTSSNELNLVENRISFSPLTAEERTELFKHFVREDFHELVDKDLEAMANEAHNFTCSDILHAVTFARLKQKQAQDTFIKDHLILAVKETSPSFMQKAQYQTQKVLWSDIFGYEKEKAEILNILERKKQDTSYQFPGILLYGPPGCSKTMLVKALVTESKYNFFPVRGADLLSKYVGDSEGNLHRIFEKAKMAAPSIVFLDEVDNLCAKRSSTDGGSMLPDLLSIFSEVSTRLNVFIIGATNRPDLLDFALFTSNRFTRRIFIQPPSFESNKAFWDGLLNHSMPHHNIDTAKLARRSEGYSGAELMEAFKSVVSRIISNQVDDKPDLLPLLTEDDFLTVLSPRHTKTNIVMAYCHKFQKEIGE